METEELPGETPPDDPTLPDTLDNKTKPIRKLTAHTVCLLDPYPVESIKDIQSAEVSDLFGDRDGVFLVVGNVELVFNDGDGDGDEYVGVDSDDDIEEVDEHLLITPQSIVFDDFNGQTSVWIEGAYAWYVIESFDAEDFIAETRKSLGKGFKTWYTAYARTPIKPKKTATTKTKTTAVRGQLKDCVTPLVDVVGMDVVASLEMDADEELPQPPKQPSNSFQAIKDHNQLHQGQVLTIDKVLYEIAAMQQKGPKVESVTLKQVVPSDAVPHLQGMKGVFCPNFVMQVACSPEQVIHVSKLGKHKLTEYQSFGWKTDGYNMWCGEKVDETKHFQVNAFISYSDSNTTQNGLQQAKVGQIVKTKTDSVLVVKLNKAQVASEQVYNMGTQTVEVPMSRINNVLDVVIAKDMDCAKRALAEIDTFDKIVVVTKESIKQTPVAKLKRKLRGMDLFAGCGGFSVGLDDLVEHVYAVEIVPEAANTYKENFPKCKVLQADINELLTEVKNYDGKSGCQPRLPTPQADDAPEVIYGGPPCQGFSGVNRWKTGNSTNNSLLYTFMAFVEYYTPAIAIIENVKEICTQKLGRTQLPDSQQFAGGIAHGYISSVTGIAMALGYQVRVGTLNALCYGSPSTRRRTFIILVRQGIPLPQFVQPTHQATTTSLAMNGGNVENPVYKWPSYCAITSTSALYSRVTCGNAISDLDIQFSWVEGQHKVVQAEKSIQPNKCKYATQPKSDFQRVIRSNGPEKPFNMTTVQLSPINITRVTKVLTWEEFAELPPTHRAKLPKHGRPTCDHMTLPEELDAECLWFTAKARNSHKFWRGLFGRIQRDGEFPTILTDINPMGKRGTTIHYCQRRVLTVRECARAQSFPDKFSFCGIPSACHKQIGNAVPPMLGRAICRTLIHALEGVKDLETVLSRKHSAKNHKNLLREDMTAAQKYYRLQLRKDNTCALKARIEAEGKKAQSSSKSKQPTKKEKAMAKPKTTNKKRQRSISDNSSSSGSEVILSKKKKSKKSESGSVTVNGTKGKPGKTTENTTAKKNKDGTKDKKEKKEKTEKKDRNDKKKVKKRSNGQATKPVKKGRKAESSSSEEL